MALIKLDKSEHGNCNLSNIAVNLLTILPKSNEYLFETHLGKIIFLFAVANHKQNEFYNHYAFEVTKQLVQTFQKKVFCANRERLIIGALLQKFITWGYMHIELKHVFEQLDNLCAQQQSTNTFSDIEKAWMIIYLYERHSNDKKADQNKFYEVYRLNNFCSYETFVKAKIKNTFLKKMLVSICTSLNKGLPFAIEFDNEPMPNLCVTHPYSQSREIINFKSILDKGFTCLIARSEKYMEQELFYKSLFV